MQIVNTNGNSACMLLSNFRDAEYFIVGQLMSIGQKNFWQDFTSFRMT